MYILRFKQFLVFALHDDDEDVTVNVKLDDIGEQIKAAIGGCVFGVKATRTIIDVKSGGFAVSARFFNQDMVGFTYQLPEGATASTGEHWPFDKTNKPGIDDTRVLHLGKVQWDLPAHIQVSIWGRFTYETVSLDELFEIVAYNYMFSFNEKNVIPEKIAVFDMETLLLLQRTKQLDNKQQAAKETVSWKTTLTREEEFCHLFIEKTF